MPDILRELEKARLQLLDTSNRNRLLSIPQHGRAKVVHVVDETSDEVYRILCQGGKSTLSAKVELTCNGFSTIFGVGRPSSLGHLGN